MISGMWWRGTRTFGLALVCAGLSSCVVRTSDATDSSGPGQYVPAKPSFTADAGAAGDGAAANDASGDTGAGDAPADAAADASAPATQCEAEAHCAGTKLVSQAPGRLLCSKAVEQCPYGCHDTDAGAACTVFDPAQCTDGVPFVPGSLCKYEAFGWCFESAAVACACAGCDTKHCYVPGRLKLPFKVDGGFAPVPSVSSVKCVQW
jgi:hypothetical protein